MERTQETKKLKILLVEDVMMFLSIAQELLKDHYIKTAKTAKEAVDVYSSYKPDITFLDIALPDGTGHDVLKNIREIDKSAYVIMVTASRAQEDIDLAVKNGANGYIMKPYSHENISSSIEEYLLKNTKA